MVPIDNCIYTSQMRTRDTCGQFQIYLEYLETAINDSQPFNDLLSRLINYLKQKGHFQPGSLSQNSLIAVIALLVFCINWSIQYAAYCLEYLQLFRCIILVHREHRNPYRFEVIIIGVIFKCPAVINSVCRNFSSISSKFC